MVYFNIVGGFNDPFLVVEDQSVKKKRVKEAAM